MWQKLVWKSTLSHLNFSCHQVDRNSTCFAFSLSRQQSTDTTVTITQTFCSPYIQNGELRSNIFLHLIFFPSSSSSSARMDTLLDSPLPPLHSAPMTPPPLDPPPHPPRHGPKIHWGCFILAVFFIFNRAPPPLDRPQCHPTAFDYAPHEPSRGWWVIAIMPCPYPHQTPSLLLDWWCHAGSPLRLPSPPGWPSLPASPLSSSDSSKPSNPNPNLDDFRNYRRNLA